MSRIAKTIPEDKVEKEIEESNIEGWVAGADDSTLISIEDDDGVIRNISFRKDPKTEKYIPKFDFDPKIFEVIPALEGQKYFSSACRMYKEPETFVPYYTSDFMKNWLRDLKIYLSDSITLKEFAEINPESFEFYEQGKEINPFNLGEGEKSYITIINFLDNLRVPKKIEEKHYKSDKCYLALIDEPETHLHPNAREALLEKIREACGEGIQVIYTTHSENFLDADDLEGFVRVYKENGITKARQLTDCELSSTCDKKLPIGDYWSVKLNSDQLKGFFADVILLVEGQTEQYALPIYLSRTFLSEHGIQIVPCYSKSAIPTYWRLFTAYGYKCFIVFDHDDDIPPKLEKRAKEAETQKKKKAIQGEIKNEIDKNQNLEKLCKFKASPSCPYTMSSLGACFKDNWESYFKEALGRDYQDIWSNLQKTIDDFSNKSLDAKAIAQEVRNKGYNMPPFITAIKARLRGLSEMSEDQYQMLIKKMN